jgi:CheY-like chemotaxis protein
VKSFSFIIDKYQFTELEGGYSIGFGNRYPLYTAALSNDTHGIDINRINQLFGSDQTPRIKDVRTKQQSQQLQRQQQKYSANIMVIDDEPDILFTYECFLSDEGYNVEAFADPQEALKHFVQLSGAFSSYYQLVLLDIRMPRLNGLQLYNTIKTLSPNTKIMFVSALDMAEELTSILPDMKYGDIIRKPVEREYFIRKINSMLNN